MPSEALCVALCVALLLNRAFHEAVCLAASERSVDKFPITEDLPGVPLRSFPRVLHTWQEHPPMVKKDYFGAVGRHNPRDI